MTQLFVCECNNQFQLDEDQHFQYLDGGEKQVLFTGCNCGRGKMGLILVEGD